MFKKLVISLFAVSFLWAGIWIYFNPVPVSWCPESSYVTNYIFVYSDQSEDIKIKLPETYLWNFSCPKDNSMYNGKTDKHIFMSWMRGSSVENADVVSFKSLSETYAKDKNNAYSWGEVIKNADAASFEVIQERPIATSKDKNNIYFWGNIFEGVHPTDFSIIWCDIQTCYIHDKKNVYWTYWDWFKRVTVTWADVETFKYVEWSNTRPVAVDKNHVYYRGIVVENLSPRNFKEIWEGFYKNKTKIYGAWVWIIEGVDMGTFECVPNSIVRSLTECHDRDYIYHIGGKDLVKKPRIK
jgi:hypothetical protein